MSQKITYGGAALALFAAGIYAGRVLAAGAPTQAPLTYSGIVTTDTGQGLPNAVDVAVSFFDAPSGGNLTCMAPSVKTDGPTGRFSVVLPEACAVAVQTHADLWAQAAVGPGKTVLPRAHVGAVPYALEANGAKVAASASAATGGLQQQIAAMQTKLDALQSKVDSLPTGSGSGGAAGTTLKVYDTAGAYLGVLIDLFRGNTNNPVPLVARILTPKGYLHEMTVDGKPFSPSALVYTSTNCTGQAWGTPGNLVAQIPGNYLHYSKMSQSYLAVTPVGKGITADATGFGQQSYELNGLCTNSTASIVAGVKFDKISRADAGIPEKVTGFLQFKAE